MTPPVPGLRARKAALTRAALIDAAVAMCLNRGHENTTVELIAAAAGVSQRTFTRYFPSKDAVFVAALGALPPDLGPLAAMRRALGAVLTHPHPAPSSSSAQRVVRIVQVVTASKALEQAAIAYRSPQVVEAMADRMGVGIDDPRLDLAMELIGITVLSAWNTVVAANVPLKPDTIAEQVDRTFATVATLTSDWTPDAPEGR